MGAVDLHSVGALALPTPYLLFVGNVTESGYAKTAFGLRDCGENKCVGEAASAPEAVITWLARMTPAEAATKGARALVIAVANPGGVIPPAWRATLVEAMEAGLDLVSGKHVRLADVPGLADAARRLGRRLIDVRVPPVEIPVGHRAQAHGQAVADRRHRLRAGQEIHRAGARRHFQRARRRRRFSRHRTDRHYDRGQRHPDGRGPTPGIRCGGVSYNTAALDKATATRVMAADGESLGLPVVDPMRPGPAFDRLVDACLA